MRGIAIAAIAAAAALGLAPASLAAQGGTAHPPRAGASGAAAPAEFVILDYHSFKGEGKSNIDFSTRELAEQLDRMSAAGLRFVSLEDALAGRIEGQANIVVTIDDGNRSVYAACKEVFEPRGIKPFLFVYPAIILGRLKFALSPEQLAELVADGCGVGAHGYNHDSLSEESWKKDYVQFRRELKLPGPAIARLTGVVPTLYAYPFGIRSDRAEAALPGYGYSYGFVADDYLHPIRLGDPSLDRMALPRTIMYRYNEGIVIKSMERRLALSGGAPGS
jgi:peptidoglycan/xylan/chitin deacetylase (PgdA/CDA1 family)